MYHNITVTTIRGFQHVIVVFCVIKTKTEDGVYPLDDLNQIKKKNFVVKKFPKVAFTNNLNCL